MPTFHVGVVSSSLTVCVKMIANAISELLTQKLEPKYRELIYEELLNVKKKIKMKLPLKYLIKKNREIV